MNKSIFGFLVILTTALMGFFIRYRTNWLSVLHPKLLAGFRFILAGFSMVIVVKPSNARVSSFFQTAGVRGCFFIGLRTILAGELSILTFMNPLFLLLDDPVHWYVAVGGSLISSAYFWLTGNSTILRQRIGHVE
ncbi:hypothetical protein QUF86_02835 [Peribacillus sp. NJ11]|uniref:hypothetical protein n=1 Tax=Peribacillus sp. NJ11 TaxID=3055861 RepID=UPI0025A2948F|nr:hypothetical protein [Peribacillus sp. NJ11]MDM5219752.1 hypothetical protein [Peribacillus sp. NJ11]